MSLSKETIIQKFNLVQLQNMANEVGLSHVTPDGWQFILEQVAAKQGLKILGFVHLHYNEAKEIQSLMCEIYEA